MMSNIEISGMLNRMCNEILGIIMSDQPILKFLYYNKDEDVLSKPDLTKKEIMTMRDVNFFRHKKIPTIESNDQRTVISIEFDEVSRRQSYGHRDNMKYWVRPTVGVYVIGHATNDNTKNGSRVWAIEDRLVDLFHYKLNDISLGASCVIGSEDLYGLPYPYFGRVVKITFWDKNEGLLNG